jgi:N-acetylneuraminic acid mutarotase
MTLGRIRKHWDSIAMAKAALQCVSMKWFGAVSIGPGWLSAIVAGATLVTARVATGQAGNGSVRIVPAPNGVTISWTNRGTLQSALAVTGDWRDLLEAPNPVTRSLGNSREFYRTINRWSTRSNLLEANSEMAVAELDGRIYVMGGYPASRVTQRTVQVYDVAQNRWSLTTPLPLGLNHQMAAAVNGRLYVIGGQTDSGNTSFTNTVFEYHPATSNWTAKAPMPTARAAGGAAVVGSRIYVAGGRPPRGADFAVYDTATDQWTTLPNLPTARNHLAACAIAGRIYVAGGRIEAGFSSVMTNVLEMYEPSASQWTRRAPMPTTRGGINGIAVNDFFFVWGGEGPNGPANPTGMFNQVEMYSARSNRWSRLESLPVAVHGVTGAAYVNGWIHAPGGGTSTGGSSGSTIHQVFWVGPLADSVE